jgi:hypothetical protein
MFLEPDYSDSQPYQDDALGEDSGDDGGSSVVAA